VARIVVAGAPCAGKSAYVREHMLPGDLVYDYDTLHQALSGLGLYQHNDQIRPYVLRARDAVLDLLAESPSENAWIITATPKADEVTRLRDLIGGTVMLLEIDAEEAHRRCEIDGRPQQWHDYIDNWFRDTDVDTGDWKCKGRQKVDMKRKDYRGRIKLLDNGQAGEFEAVFATLNVIDYDGEVTVPGAFQDGQEVRVSSWGHNWGDLPVGRGTIRENDDEALILGKFFLQTEGGRETYETVKALGNLQEWSYGFDVTDWEEGEFEDQDVIFLKGLDVVEVSPVMLGAGVNTHTVDIKSQKATKPSRDARADPVKRAKSDAVLLREIIDEELAKWQRLDDLNSSGAKGDGRNEDEGTGDVADQGKAGDGTPRNPDATDRSLRAMIYDIQRENEEMQEGN